MPLKNGILYIDRTDELNPIGITFREIAKCIGVGSQDLGTLAGHSNNNKWSYCKPVRNIEHGVLSKDRFKSEDIFFGFDKTRIYQRTGKQILDNALSDKEWIYLRPQGSIDINPYRTLQDYDGYNHYAPAPYDFSETIKSYVSYAAAGSNISVAFDFKKNSNAEIKVTDFGALTGADGYELTDWKYAMLWRKSGENEPQIEYSVLSENVDNTGDRESVSIVFTDPGTYDCVFVITTETTQEPMQLPSIWLSGGAFQFTLTFKRIPVQFDVSKFNVLDIIPNTETGNIVINTAPFDFWATLQAVKPVEAGNVGITGITANLTLKFYAYNTSGEQIGLTWQTFSDAIFFDPRDDNAQYDPETLTQTFYTNLTPIMGDSLDIGNFDGKTGRVAYLALSFEPDTILTNESNTYLYTIGEPMGGFKIIIKQ